MKNIAKSLLIILCTSLFGTLSTSCTKDNQPLVENIFNIAQDELEVGFLKTSSSTLVPVNTNLSPDQWKVTATDRWCTVEQSDIGNETAIKISVTANNDKKTRKTTITAQSTLKTYTISVSQHGTETTLETIADIRILPTGGRASEAQPGSEIKYTWDGIIGSGQCYHSIWNQKANFPVTLEYYFNANKNEEIDYFIYHSRNGNGNFGKFNIYVSTNDHPHYVLYGSYDFKMKNTPQRVDFEGGLKGVRNIKLEVHSGLNDFVSCDEMEFLKKAASQEDKNQLHTLLLNVFSDLSCSELNTETNDRKIALLPAFYANLALQLRNGTYPVNEKKFRAATYQPYSIVEEWADKLMTKKYSNLDNPTGICVEEGDELNVLVSDTHEQSISLQCIGEEDADGYVQVASSGDNYFIEKGANKLTMRSSGQLFVMYNTNLTSPEAKPIRIHFTPGSGKVTGFFDLKTDKTDEAYAELLAKATHKYFCVRGEKIIFYFHTAKMREHVNNEIRSAIHLWDDIISWQQELMGIDDVRPSQVNNHLFAFSPEGSYMWASDYRIAFADWKLGDILLKDNVMAVEDNAWGPAHETGHIHQSAINWASSTESSNNLFSNYVIYKLGKYKSRGKGLNQLAKARFGQGRSWLGMLNPPQPDEERGGEDTELHMRMNWQLWNWYHRCEAKTDFWPTLFKLMRNLHIGEGEDCGRKQLEFAKMASKAANENLTDFFETWGFFEPVQDKVYQYGTYDYIVTEQQIKDAKAYMAQFPAPKRAIQYIEDRKTEQFSSGDYRYKEVGDVGYYTQFKDNMKITQNPTYTLNVSTQDKTILVRNGEEAVAFEVRKQEKQASSQKVSMGKLVYFANSFEFKVPSNIDISDCEIYAVQADGERKLMAPINQ